MDILDSLLDPFPPPLVQVFATEDVIGINNPLAVKCSQTFSQVRSPLSTVGICCETYPVSSMGFHHVIVGVVREDPSFVKGPVHSLPKTALDHLLQAKEPKAVHLDEADLSVRPRRGERAST